MQPRETLGTRLPRHAVLLAIRASDRHEHSNPFQSYLVVFLPTKPSRFQSIFILDFVEKTLAWRAKVFYQTE